MKNIDLYFIKELSSGTPYYQLVGYDRLVAIDPSEYTDESRLNVIQTFIKSSILGTQDIPGVFPDEVVTVLNYIVSLGNQITIYELNSNLGVLDIHGYKLLYVERDDLMSESEDVEDWKSRSLIVNNVLFNSEITSCYYGRGFDNMIEGKFGSAYRFLDSFGLDSSQLQINNLSNGFNAYNVLSSQGKTEDVNDIDMINFLNSRGFSYLIIING